jgi:hypothetical protein
MTAARKMIAVAVITESKVETRINTVPTTRTPTTKTRIPFKIFNFSPP